MSITTESWSLVRITKAFTFPVPPAVRLLVCRHFFKGTPGHELVAQGEREAMFAAARLAESADGPVANDFHTYVDGAPFWSTFAPECVTVGSRIYVDGTAYLVTKMVHDQLFVEAC